MMCFEVCGTKPIKAVDSGIEKTGSTQRPARHSTVIYPLDATRGVLIVNMPEGSVGAQQTHHRHKHIRANQVTPFQGWHDSANETDAFGLYCQVLGSSDSVITSEESSSSLPRSFVPYKNDFLESLLVFNPSDLDDLSLKEEFHRKLRVDLIIGGEIVAKKMLNLIKSGRIQTEISEEICEALGLINYPNSHKHSVYVLAGLLTHKSATIRDSAAMALAVLNNKLAIPALIQAMSTEKRQSLKRRYESVVEQIRASQT